MALDMPPPIVPEQGEVQPGSAIVTASFQNYTVHVLGAAAVDGAQLSRAIAAADTLSNAVRAVASAYYAAGYPAARVVYSLQGQDLYVLVSLDGLTATEGEARITRYFDGVVGESPLTAGALEPRRVLASVHADRAGLDLLSSLRPGDGGAVLQLQPGPDPVDPTQVVIEIGNPGNRFVGRYFIDFNLRTGTRWGDEFRAIARSGQRGFSDAEDGDYFEQHLGWNRVTPWGIFGLGGRYVDYRYDDRENTPAVSVNGGVTVGEVYWLYPLLADLRSRLTVQGKVDRIDNANDISSTGQAVLRELYTSVEAAATYQYGFEWLDFRWDLDAGLSVRKGLGDSSAPLTNANLDYLLYRPSLRLRNYLTERYSVALELSAQFSGDTVPQQQQWVMGGLGNLSSALPGLAVGDQGYLVRLVGAAGDYELYGVSVSPKVFIESGAAEFDALRSDKPALSDIGFEVGVRVYDWLEGSLAYAESLSEKDLSQADLDAADANLYFRLQFKF
jgi:hemolysin activation/secretion protein